MVASDTVVGIVGSVILVAVMAGVFAYEYNNTPDGGAGGGSADTYGSPEAFERDHPLLVGTQDIDHDGLRNYEDPDLDNDGVNNTEDDHLVVVEPWQGSVGQTTPAAVERASRAVNASAGVRMVEAYVNYTTALPAPLPPVPAFAVSLRNADGEEVANAPGTQGGTARSHHLRTEGGLTEQEYVLVVEQPNPGPGGPFQAVVLVHYAAA